MNLFQLGDFTLSSGKKSSFRIDCDALSEEDIKTLAWMISQLVGDFSSVEGIPRGGMRLALALEEYKQEPDHKSANPFKWGRTLLVDDVYTSGASMHRAEQEWTAKHPDKGSSFWLVGAVIFARGPCPSWINPLFTLDSFFSEK